MSSPGYAPPGLAPAQPRRHAILDAWQRVTPAQAKGAFIFGNAVFLYHVIVWSPKIFAGDGTLVASLLALFISNQFWAFALMLALVAADRVTGNQPARRAAYVAAVLATAGFVAPLEAIPCEWYFTSPFSWLETAQSASYIFFERLALGGVAAFIYTDRRRARASQARMHAAQIERAYTAKRALESRLAAMQARVEPQFLFNTLAQVRELYRASSALGERMLDELIAYLRAAMPRMRDTSSTLVQEIELVRAYLAIVKVRLGDRLIYEIDSPGDAGGARMPPMVLLPLADHAIVHGFERSRTTGAMRVTAAASDGRLRVTIDDSYGGFDPKTGGDEIAPIRERLAALYGANASLDLATRDGATRAVLELPYEAPAAAGSPAQAQPA